MVEGGVVDVYRYLLLVCSDVCLSFLHWGLWEPCELFVLKGKRLLIYSTAPE